MWGLMNVIEFLTNVDPADIAGVYASRRDYYDMGPLSADKVLEEHVKPFLGVLGNVEVISSHDEVMFGSRGLEVGKPTVSSQLCRKSEIAGYVPAVDDEQMDLLCEMAAEMSVEELTEAMRRVWENMPERYSYVFSDWAEILGCELVVLDLDAEEQAELAEDILWELAFNGTDPAQRSKTVSEIVESLERDAEELSSLVDAAGGDVAAVANKEAAVSLEELREKYGIADTRTQEEKDEDLRLMMVDELVCSIGLSRAIAAVARKFSTSA
ncbi:MAG: hypothetical protein BZ138_06850 [Methanosphaera sp. rholeuAM270]|nr:MAG: hypothetical protein BZ138_06850 [Methanosphaera sp. rholeuAM270]